MKLKLQGVALLAVLATVLNLPSAMANDPTIAKAGEYFVKQHLEDQSAILLLGKVHAGGGEPEILARDEDIVPRIAKLVPPHEALELATQLAANEIRGNGGAAKTQASIDEQAKKYGVEFFNYLTPLSVAGYKANGVTIPHSK